MYGAILICGRYHFLSEIYIISKNIFEYGEGPAKRAHFVK